MVVCCYFYIYSDVEPSLVELQPLDQPLEVSLKQTQTEIKLAKVSEGESHCDIPVVFLGLGQLSGALQRFRAVGNGSATGRRADSNSPQSREQTEKIRDLVPNGI